MLNKYTQLGSESGGLYQEQNIIFWSDFRKSMYSDCCDLTDPNFMILRFLKILICIIMNYYVFYISVPIQNYNN